MDVDELPIVSTVIIVGNFLHVKLYFHSIVIAGPLITYVWWSICPCFVLHTHFYSSLLWPLTHAHAHNLISAPDSSPNEGTVAPLLIDILDGYGNNVKQSFSWSNRFFLRIFTLRDLPLSANFIQIKYRQKWAWWGRSMSPASTGVLG